MSEATTLDEMKAKLAQSDPMLTLEALEIVRRLASLNRNGELGELVEAPMDALLTSKQAGDWLQRTPALLNADAKAGRIPAVPCGDGWRFHPRTILEEGHRRFFKTK